MNVAQDSSCHLYTVLLLRLIEPFLTIKAPCLLRSDFRFNHQRRLIPKKIRSLIFQPVSVLTTERKVKTIDATREYQLHLSVR